MIENYSLHCTKKYDLVVMGSILEHVNNPMNVLKAVSNIISNGGHLFVRVPDVEELHLDTIGDVFPFEHPHTYSANSLRRFYSRNGFKDICITKHNQFKRHLIGIAQKTERLKSSRFPNNHQRMMDLIGAYNRSNAAIRDEANMSMLHLQSSGKRITIFGAGAHTEFLFRYTSIMLCSIAGVVDSNPKKHGLLLEQYEIKDPSWISAENTDVVIISSRAFQDQIYSQLEHLQLQGIELLCLYDTSKSAYRFVESYV